MSETTPLYRASLHVPRDQGRDDVLLVGDFRVDYHGGIVRGHVLLARKMLAAGLSNGELLVTSNMATPGSPPISHGLLSDLAAKSEFVVDLRQSAEEVVEVSAQVQNDDLVLSAVAREWLDKLITDASVWSDVPGRSRAYFRQHGLVTEEKTVATVTPLGHELAAKPAEVLITPVQRAALDLCPMAVAKWNENVHFKTQKALLDRGWVSEKRGKMVALSIEEIGKLSW